MGKKRQYIRKKPLKHVHSWDAQGELICGCIYRDGYILVTPEEQVNEKFFADVKEL